MASSDRRAFRSSDVNPERQTSRLPSSDKRGLSKEQSAAAAKESARISGLSSPALESSTRAIQKAVGEELARRQRRPGTRGDRVKASNQSFEALDKEWDG